MFRIKQGNTSPVFERTLRDKDGKPVNITGFTEVEFHMRDDDYTTIVDADTNGGVSVDIASSGRVSYEWATGDTSDIGSYDAEFEVIFSDGSTQSFPYYGLYSIEVVEDI